MARMFEELNDEELEVGEGAWGFVDWYNSTDGGKLSTLLAKREMAIDELILCSVQLSLTMVHTTRTK